jgi:acyl transferase domain-containing protein/acyl carrier protein
LSSISALAKGLPVAIVGIGCRFPGGVMNATDLWKLLSAGGDAIAEIPASRIDLNHYFDSRPATPGRMMTRWGGFLDGIEDFDAGFFGIAPREAERLDPQQRLLLETAWEALEDAGQNVQELEGAPVGVFIGQWLSDFESRLFAEPESVDFYMTTGSGRYAASGRLSYALGLRGPSLTLDTACSSSLTAVHLAVGSLRSGESELAIAGGVNIILQPQISIAYSQSLMMAPDGRCKFGDAQGNGYVRSEGAGLVVLKPLDRALANGDRIYGVIRGSAVNNDGASSGSMGTPSRIGQEELLRNAYRDAGCSAGEVSYVEAHGTGTRKGDPIELGALGTVLGEGRSKGSKALVGSIKTNLGHTEAAAGVAGLIKAALALHHRQIPASLNCTELNPAIDWENLPCNIARQAEPWTGERRLAGVSAFGIAGSNAHVVLEAAPSAPATLPLSSSAPDDPVLLPLSARSPQALQALAGSYANLIASSDSTSLKDVCATAALHRTPLEHRAVFVAESRTDVVERLRQFARGEPDAAQASGTVSGGRRRIAFVFPGQGAQWIGMARELFAKEPVFRASIERAETALKTHVDWSLIAQLHENDGSRDFLLDDISVIQPVLLFVEIALAELWRSRGITPDAVIGHSMGEIAAAYIVGALDLDAAVATICRRSSLMRQVSGQGAMALVELSMPEASELLERHEGRASVAVVNGPRASVISGDKATINAVVAKLEQRGVFARLIKVDAASHSAQMDPLVPQLVDSLSGVKPRLAEIPLYSTVNAARIDGHELDARYWGRNLRQTVLFERTVSAMLDDGIDTFIEMSPHPTLLDAIQQTAAAAGREVLALQSLRREEGERRRMLSTLGELFVAGYPIDSWIRQDNYRRVDLPSYPWQRERFWPKDAPSQPKPRGGASLDRFLGSPLAVSTQAGTYVWEIELSVTAFPYLADHRVNGATVFPAAGFIDIALEAAAAILKIDRVQLSEMTLDNALVLSGSDGCILQIVVEPGLGGNLAFAILSKSESSTEIWTEHARGSVTTYEHREVELHAKTISAEGQVLSEVHIAGMRALGLEYGPAFCGVRELCRMPDGIVATVALPAGVETGRYVIHPALLDACLQTGVALLQEHAAGRTIVPIGLERLQFAGRVERAASLTVHATYRESFSTILQVDLRVDDGSGRELLRLEGLQFSPLEPGMARSRQFNYSLLWKEMEPVAAEQIASSTLINWSVLLDEQGIGTVLSSLIAADRYQTMTFTSEGLGEQLDQLVQGDGHDGNDTQGIVHLWSLDTVPRDASGLIPAEVRDRACLSVLSLVKAAVSSASARKRRLYLITSAAQTVRDGEVSSIEQAPLWGLGRVVANEHPELSCTLIDLSSKPSKIEIEALARELLADTTETQVALRGDKRYVARLVVKPANKVGPLTVRSRKDRVYQVRTESPGALNGLFLHEENRKRPGVGEVEIEVEATGLNFMNVMSALGMYPGYPDGVGSLGIECAGRVTALGDRVTDLVPGDNVMAVAIDSLASHCIANASLVRKMPANLSFPTASTIPIAFLTAHHALHSLARLDPGERVLIHAATGGVGLAAVQLARLAGAEIFATAGTDEKRKLLERMGVAHVMDSRSLAFREQIMSRTGGKGVDVVLNSLAGEFIPAGLATLAPHGRFVELGKVDIYRNSRLGLSPLQQNRSFFAVDLDRMIRERPARVAKTFDHIMVLLENAKIQPLPIKVFPVSQASDAFRLMAASRHIGKVCITADDPDAAIVESNRTLLSRRLSGTCVITGGLGGLGLSVAKRWVKQGGRSLALLSRNDANPAQLEALRLLRAAGATVRPFLADVGSADELQSTFAEINSTMAPIATVIHAAGVLNDATILQQTAATFSSAMVPKVEGAWNLSQLLKDHPNVHLILFSSIASLLGLAGQSNYAAGNAFLDSLAGYRKAKGGRATVINWGPWADVGLAAAHENRGERLSLRGLRSLAPSDALDEFERILVHQPTQIAVADIDWAAYAAANRVSAQQPFVSELSQRPKLEPDITSTKARDVFAAAVAGAPRRVAMERFLQEQIGHVLRQSPSRIDEKTPFRNLGLDSLMGLELRNRLDTELSLQLPATVVWNYPTVRSLAIHLASLLGLPIETKIEDAVQDSGMAEIESLLGELEKLPDEEAARLLQLDDTYGAALD